MSESQPVTPINPTIKTSTLDSHRMISHATKPRPGSQPARGAGGPIQAPQAGEGAVVMRDAPIEAVMGGGGTIVTAPKAAHSKARQAPHPALAAKMNYVTGRAPSQASNMPVVGNGDVREDVTASAGSLVLTDGQRGLLGHLLAERRAQLVAADAPIEALAMLDDTARAIGLV